MMRDQIYPLNGINMQTDDLCISRGSHAHAWDQTIRAWRCVRCGRCDPSIAADLVAIDQIRRPSLTNQSHLMWSTDASAARTSQTAWPSPAPFDETMP